MRTRTRSEVPDSGPFDAEAMRTIYPVLTCAACYKEIERASDGVVVCRLDHTWRGEDEEDVVHVGCQAELRRQRPSRYGYEHRELIAVVPLTEWFTSLVRALGLGGVLRSTVGPAPEPAAEPPSTPQSTGDAHVSAHAEHLRKRRERARRRRGRSKG